jgi:putative ABC transport system permease protein
MAGHLPFDFAVRNLGRRKLRTVLTGLSSAMVVALIVATAAFVRGLESSFAGAAQPDVAILLSTVAERDVVRSTVAAGVEDLVAASVPGILHVHGVPAVSPEIHMATNLRMGAKPPANAPDPELNGFVRGITDRAFLVHDSVTLVEGAPPRSGEVIVGRLVAKQIGVPDSAVAVGSKIRFEGSEFTVSGRFAAPGTTTEAEIWTSLVELRGQTRRDDSSALFVRMEKPDDFSELDLFAKRRLDLELTMIPSSLYYRDLADYFRPIRNLAWALAAIMAFAALFGGANTLNAAVQDRIRELATLRAVGYSGFALIRSISTEAIVLAAAGGLIGLAVAGIFLRGVTIRIAMSAFALKVDSVSILAGFAGVLLLGVLGSAPAAAKVFRLPIASALKEP